MTKVPKPQPNNVGQTRLVGRVCAVSTGGTHRQTDRQTGEVSNVGTDPSFLPRPT